jgi:hypothetical protein
MGRFLFIMVLFGFFFSYLDMNGLMFEIILVIWIYFHRGRNRKIEETSDGVGGASG